MNKYTRTTGRLATALLGGAPSEATSSSTAAAASSSFSSLLPLAFFSSAAGAAAAAFRAAPFEITVLFPLVAEVSEWVQRSLSTDARGGTDTAP